MGTKCAKYHQSGLCPEWRLLGWPCSQPGRAGYRADCQPHRNVEHARERGRPTEHHPGYREQFEHVFGSPEVTIENVGKAIAAFERTIIAGNAPWDRFIKGEEGALSEEARRGWDLFQNKANCIRCHAGFNLTDNQFKNIGVGFDGPNPDLGRYEFTGAEGDQGRFKTPTLRALRYTGPYMHNGSEKTLEDVIEYYNRGGNSNPYLDEEMKPLELTEQEKVDLLAVLHAFEGEGWMVTAPIQLPAEP